MMITFNNNNTANKECAHSILGSHTSNTKRNNNDDDDNINNDLIELIAEESDSDDHA